MREPQSFQKQVHFLFFFFFSMSTGKVSRSHCISLSPLKREGSMLFSEPSKTSTHSKSSVCMTSHPEAGAALCPCVHFNCEFLIVTGNVQQNYLLHKANIPLGWIPPLLTAFRCPCLCKTSKKRQYLAIRRWQTHFSRKPGQK